MHCIYHILLEFFRFVFFFFFNDTATTEIYTLSLHDALPINRYTNLLLVGVALEASALVLGGFGPTEATPEFNPLLTSAGLASWIALGMVAVTALIGVMIRITLRGPRASAVQAATGFFYLAVITATTAEFAAKVGFLG